MSNMKKWHKEEVIKGGKFASQELYRIFEHDEEYKDEEKTICEIVRGGDAEEFNSRLIQFAPEMMENLIKDCVKDFNKQIENPMIKSPIHKNKYLLEIIYDKPIEEILEIEKDLN